MRNGFAYIEIKDAKILLENFFKMRLNESTKQTKKILPYLEEMNEIVAEFLEKIDSLSLGAKDYSKLNINRKDKINLADLDLLAARSFPLCMREMHKYLRANHHLKHWGRLQYGLFLKGIGLTLEDSIKFWRAEFTKKMTNDKFEKGYLYNIRHSYGKEGKRADYTPWTCAKIIQHSSPGNIKNKKK
jgi:Eukaryotic-type DNA primase, large subunit